MPSVNPFSMSFPGPIIQPKVACSRFLKLFFANACAAGKTGASYITLKLADFRVMKRTSLQTVVLHCGSSRENTVPLMRYAESIFFYFAGNNNKLFAKFQNVKRIANSTAWISFFFCPSFNLFQRHFEGWDPTTRRTAGVSPCPSFMGKGDAAIFQFLTASLSSCR